MPFVQKMEEKLVITGERRLSGEIKAAGAKNAVLKQMAAALLLKGAIRINNVPNLTDVYSMIEILEFLGAKIKFNNNILDIDSTDISGSFAPHELVNKSRASFVVLGPLLARFHEARIALPGGCQIGSRRLDLHEKGLRSLGASVKLDQGYMIATAPKIRGTKIYLDLPSNGATENIMLAGILAEGETVIENAACDPEIIDLANFLNAIGAKVRGAGTHQITIKGVKQEDLHSCEFTPISDRIEACTYLIGAISTGGDIIIKDIEPEHIQGTTSKLEEIGVEISFPSPRTLYAKAPRGRFNSIDISTGWFPGFPTDLQPIFSIPLAIANGTSTIKETIYDDRFGHVNELIRMGANIKVNNNIAVIKGTERLSGTRIVAKDIRGGAGLVIAGLIASGKTEVSGLSHIDRGYENIVQKFNSLGAKIARTKNISVESEKNSSTQSSRLKTQS